METILIADRSDDICFVLKNRLQKEFHIVTCNDGLTARALIRGMRPDGLILDLRLPMMDGLSLLSEVKDTLPPAVLITTDSGAPDYEYRRAADLGAGYVIARPFQTRSIYGHIRYLLDRAACPNPPPIDPRVIAGAHMTRLGLDCALDGYQQLRYAILFFRQDTSLSLSKELYPAIAKLWNSTDGRQVERNIRTAITRAWGTQNSVWAQYFPNCSQCPSNKKFIARLAEFTEYPQL